MISLQHSNFKNYLDLHVESIVNFCDEKERRKFKKTRLDAMIARHFPGFVANLEELLKASPDTLADIKRHFDSLRPVSGQRIVEDLDLTTLYNYFTNRKMTFDNNTNGVKYNSVYLSGELDVFTCPYCNEHYTYSFNYKDIAGVTELRRIYDWDHIYSKTHYPFLAISFFNLIPACKVCNFFKLDKNHNFYNPHSSINVDDVYCFEVDPVDPGFISDARKIQLNVVFQNVQGKDSIKTTMEVVGQLERLHEHKDLVRDILNKKRMYKSQYIQVLKAQFPIWNVLDWTEIKKTLYGVHFNQKDYHRRPFSKLTNDILKGPFV